MWEYFLDDSYYDMWAVRNNSDKSFNSVIHVMTEDEAKFLVEKLNELQKLQGKDFEKCGEINAGGSCKCTSGDTRRQEAPVEPLKKLIESQQDLPADIKKMVDDNFSELLWDTRKQDAPAEPLVSCHNCGSTVGYHSLGKACKKCHCVTE